MSDRDDIGRVEVRVQCPRCGDLLMSELLKDTPSDAWLKWFRGQIAATRDHIRHAHVCKEGHWGV